jgi:hypothetical protein
MEPRLRPNPWTNLTRRISISKPPKNPKVPGQAGNPSMPDRFLLVFDQTVKMTV